MSDISDRLLNDIVDAVKEIVRKEQSDRLRDVYLIGDIDKDSARGVIERLRELANDSRRPITLYINSAGGNVTDGLALHDAIAQLVATGVTVTIVVQGMAYSMGSVVVQAASPGRRWAFPHSWIMIHEPAKWAGWQSTTAAAQHLDRLKQMQDQIYRILAERSGKPLRQIIRDTKRTDLYLDAAHARRYGLIDEVLGQTTRVAPPESDARPVLQTVDAPPSASPAAAVGDVAVPDVEDAAAHGVTPTVEREAGADEQS
jgi:ATP-dependent Clp protease, protease subunit